MHVLSPTPFQRVEIDRNVSKYAKGGDEADGGGAAAFVGGGSGGLDPRPSGELAGPVGTRRKRTLVQNRQGKNAGTGADRLFSKVKSRGSCLCAHPIYVFSAPVIAPRTLCLKCLSSPRLSVANAEPLTRLNTSCVSNVLTVRFTGCPVRPPFCFPDAGQTTYKKHVILHTCNPELRVYGCDMKPVPTECTWG